MNNNVIVVGSINMDVVAVTPRHPRPGETIKGDTLDLLPGGKGANQAVAARRAGATTAMIGRVGDDPFADALLAFLIEEDLDVTAVERVAGSPTGTAVIAVANGENTIVIVPGANDRLRPEDVKDLAVSPHDVVIAQLEVPEPTITAAFGRARAAGAVTVLNAAPAAPCDRALLERTDVLVVNETELAVLLGVDHVATTAAEATAGARRLRRDAEQMVVVTLGSAGVVAVHQDQEIRVAGHPVKVVDTTGAGDCFVGNLAAWLSRGAAPEAALEHANAAAALSVQERGAAPSMPRAGASLHTAA